LNASADTDRDLCRRLQIDDRTLAGDRDRFFNGADAHLGVDRRGEACCHLHGLAPDLVEAGQRERHGVEARREIHNAIQARASGCCRPHPLDERRAGRFHGHAGKNGAGCILHRTRDCAERLSGGW
jgi:hypothetical protein